MPKVATVQGKLERINEQIAEAKTEFEGLTGEVTATEDALTKELGKVSVDEARVNQLESDRENFIKIQARLSARIEALGKTVPAAEKAVAQAELKSAVIGHSEAVDKVNEALDAYKGQGFELLRTFVELWHSLVDARIVAGGVRDKVNYYSALLELEQPELKTANNLTREEDEERARVIHACIPMRPDPYRTSEFSEKLRLLSQERQEKEQAIKAKKAKEEAILAR